MIFVDQTHDDVRGAPSGELSTDGEQLEHFVVAIGSGAEELHRVRGLQRSLADNLDGGPGQGAAHELAYWALFGSSFISFIALDIFFVNFFGSSS